MAEICTIPQGFEGTCNSCGYYGHHPNNCITNKSNLTYHTHAHVNAISYPSGFSWGGSGNMPWSRQQQQQQLMVNDAMLWPQQQQPQQQLISYDSDGGWVRRGINGGAGVPPPSGNGGHGSGDGSGGGNSSGGNGDNGDSGIDIGGGDDGQMAGGSVPPPNWVVEEQQDGGNYVEDDSGPLAGTFMPSQAFSAEDSTIFPTLGHGLHVLAHPFLLRHALLALSKRRIDEAQWRVGDSGASVHGTGSMDHFYNTRPPTPEESRLIVGTGEVM